MKHFALVITLFLGFSLTQVEAQSDPACCSPEWCKIFCGEKATTASTASLTNCKPSACKKVASNASTPSCGAKVAAKTAVAKTVSNTSKNLVGFQSTFD